MRSSPLFIHLRIGGRRLVFVNFVRIRIVGIHGDRISEPNCKKQNNFFHIHQGEAAFEN